MIRYLFNKLLNKPAADFLQRFSSDQSKIIQNYITNYHRKLQLIDAFGKEWDEGEIKRLRTEIEKIMRIDVSEENIVSNQTKSVRKAVDEIGCVLKNEINQKNRKSEEEIDKDLISLNSKLQVLDKNLKLQEKWFEKNKNVFEQNKHKDELINLIRREGSTLFDVESTDIHDLIEKTTHLMQMFNSEIISRNTYEECEAELRREIAEFDRDRLDFSVESTKMLGGGFKNPVILVRTSSACDYVAKAYTGSVEFHESRRARKFIMAAGGLVPEVVRVSDNEIICKSVHGESVKALFTSGNSQAPDAFYMLGRSLATIHSNTLNSMRLYDPRMLFKSGITKDYARLKEHIKILLKRKLVSPQTHNEFLRIKRKFFQKYVSLIQGDAHLDNFFYVSDPRSIIIIDYDDARPGDPLSDVGRVVASIRIWQYKGHLDEPYVERMIGLFFRGYRSVLNIELGGTNLYALRLYMIKLKSAEKLTEKIEYIIDNDKSIRDDCGGDLSRFFLNNTFMKAENYFHTEEFKKIVELKFCLGQIESFVHGKAVAVNDSVLR